MKAIFVLLICAALIGCSEAYTEGYCGEYFEINDNSFSTDYLKEGWYKFKRSEIDGDRGDHIRINGYWKTKGRIFFYDDAENRKKIEEWVKDGK